MKEEVTKTKDILAIILALFGIILSLTKRDDTTLIFIVILAVLATIIAILSNYIKQIQNNTKEMGEIKDNFKISERLNKLELKVFKK